MKKFNKLTAVLVCLFIFIAVVYGAINRKTVACSIATPALLASGRTFISLVTLTNPTTDYICYDMWTTTATPSDATADKILIDRVFVPTKSTKEVSVKQHTIYDFRVGISTHGHANIWDGDRDHSITLEYR